MPIMRNPFRRQDENVRPTANGQPGLPKGPHTPTTPNTALPVDIKQSEPAEYKLSEINDSGVFLPPSPPERKSFWTTSSSRSTTSSTRRSVVNENEPFNISRESFESYRRSFDISARSPVILAESRGRASLDSRTFQPPPLRMSNSYNRPLQATPLNPQQESDEDDADALQDVPLDDSHPRPAVPAAPAHKRRGMLSRIMDSSDSHTERPPSQDSAARTSSWHPFTTRKRGQSGQGSELGAIALPPPRENTPKPNPPATHPKAGDAVTTVAGARGDAAPEDTGTGARTTSDGKDDS